MNVCVLMSSYNGEKYIKEQIESILSQQEVEIHLVIRDDGSTDSTVSIIQDFLEKDSRIILIQGDNLGCAKSFFNLIQVDYEADYYAFADQDDVWLPQKLIKTIETIKKIKAPALGFCNLLVSDSELNPIQELFSESELERIKYRMKRDYYCNIHGCVMVWNRALHIALQRFTPGFPVMHDIWINTVANSIGTVCIERTPLILYRQHGNNVCAYSDSLIGRFKKAFKLYLHTNYLESDKVATAILSNYDDMLDKTSTGYQTLLNISRYKRGLINKIKLINTDIIKKDRLVNRLFRTWCILINKY